MGSKGKRTRAGVGRTHERSVPPSLRGDPRAPTGRLVTRGLCHEPGPIAAGFERGVRVLVAAEAAPRGQPADGHRGAGGWWSPSSFAEGSAARRAARHLAGALGVEEGELIADAKLAEAVR